MGLLDKVLKVFVGDKSKQDVASIQPIVEKIKSFESQLEKLSHDELRQKTTEFKAKIANALADNNAAQLKLQSEADETEDIDRKEEIYSEIDKLKDDAYLTVS